jgi:hypothetical protein
LIERVSEKPVCGMQRRAYNRLVPRDRRPSLWESLKRALLPASPPFLAPENASPGAPTEEPARRPDPATLVEESPPPAIAVAVASVPIEPVSFAEPPPVLVRPPREDAPPSSPPVTARPPEAVSTEPARPPRLARGLASFSRDNPEREKKFAHLLHDPPSSAANLPSPPHRRG